MVPFGTCLVLITLLHVVVCGRNLLNNADLDEDKLSIADGGWYCHTCHADLSTDSHTGTHSVKVTNRHAGYSGLWYEVSLTPGTSYYMRAYIKLIDLPVGHNTSQVKAKVVFHKDSGDQYLTMGQNNFMQSGIWQAVGGDFTVPPGVTSGRLYVVPTRQEVNYLLDTTSLVEIPALTGNWRDEANASIDRIRKSNLTVRIAGHVNPRELGHLSVEIVQTSHKFAFGSAVKAAWMTDPHYEKYQRCFYDNFEWGVLENKLKWRGMQFKESHIDYDTPIKAIDEMLRHGIKIRAHNLFWSKPADIPNWVLNSTGSLLWTQMTNRINSIVPKVKGKVKHWDVNNENLHFHFFEDGTGDVNVTMWMLREVHKIDPDVKLFLSDYQILKSQQSVQAYYDQAVMYRNTKDLPLYGVSIHGHVTAPLNMAVLKYRLSQMAGTKLPLWITELDITDHDVIDRANYLTDLLTLLFSTPEVEGILLWGFWDKAMVRTASLFDGDNLVANEAGQRYQQLFKHDWRTFEVVSLASGIATIRGFKGDYNIRVLRDGIQLHTQHATLNDDLDVKVTVTGNGHGLKVAQVLIG